MSDLKLFRVNASGVTELPGQGVDVEKSLQNVVAKNLDGLLAVRLLGSEYSTGRTHAGRIDTLGIDENGSPVIVEYKRSRNQNVINQGLYYLDWLLDHQGEFSTRTHCRFRSETIRPSSSLDCCVPLADRVGQSILLQRLALQAAESRLTKARL